MKFYIYYLIYSFKFIQQIDIEYLATLFKALETQHLQVEKSPCSHRADNLQEEKDSVQINKIS